MEIENIKPIKIPILQLQWSDKSVTNLNVKEFMSGIIKNPKSEYWRILDQKKFEQVSIENGGLSWPQVLEVMYCGGETTKSDVHFSAKEISTYLAKTQA